EFACSEFCAVRRLGRRRQPLAAGRHPGQDARPGPAADARPAPGEPGGDGPMSEPLVLYELRRPAALLTINRPDRRNALSQPLIAALREPSRRPGHAAAVRCVVLPAAGPSFCAGMALAELQETLARPATEDSPVWDNSLKLARLYDLMYTLPKPTI